MVMKFTNNATSTLASNITSIATSLTVAGGGGALFPTLTASDYFYCTLANSSGTIEIIKVTARSTDTFTITRAQDNTVASAFTAGDKVELRLVAASLNDLPKLDEANTFSAANTFSTTLGVTGAATLSSTLGVTGVSTLTAGAVIQGLTVGRGAGAVATNTAVGASALQANTTSSQTVAIGYQALASKVSSYGDTAVGYQALTAATTGRENTAVGSFALGVATTGLQNVAVGTQAMSTNVVGNANVAVGKDALYSSTASNNTAVGYQAGYSATGTGNTFIGNLSGNGATTGSYNVYIGYGTLPSSATVGTEMVICTGTAYTGKGTNTGFIQPNTGGVYQGNNSSTWSTTSDRRLKKNIVDNTVGLDAITSIRVRNFEYRLPEEVDAELKPTDSIEKSGVQLGVIAQELQQVLPDCVKTESTGVMSVDPDNLTWYMVNAIKELSAKVQALEAQINGASA